MKTLLLISLVFLLYVLVSCLASPSTPAHAQEPFQTPTPLPDVKATLDAAPAARQAAQDNIKQADQMDAQAAELRRNGITQSQQADQAISDARVAAASQNFVAMGEAIGRADSNLIELSKTNAAQASMIITLTTNQKIQAAEYISKSIEADNLRGQLQQSESQKQTIQAAYDATVKRTEGSSSTNGFIWLAAAAMLIAFVAVVMLIRRPRNVTPPDTPLEAEWRQTPLDDDRREDDRDRNES